MDGRGCHMHLGLFRTDHIFLPFHTLRSLMDFLLNLDRDKPKGQKKGKEHSGDQTSSGNLGASQHGSVPVSSDGG